MKILLKKVLVGPVNSTQDPLILTQTQLKYPFGYSGHIHIQRFTFFFFSLRREFHVFSVRSVHCSRNLQTYFFRKTFLKNKSHGTIYIFKNYFITVFSIFSFQFSTVSKRTWKENSIQTHASYIPSINYLKEK